MRLQGLPFASPLWKQRDLLDLASLETLLGKPWLPALSNIGFGGRCPFDPRRIGQCAMQGLQIAMEAHKRRLLTSLPSIAVNLPPPFKSQGTGCTEGLEAQTEGQAKWVGEAWICGSGSLLLIDWSQRLLRTLRQEQRRLKNIAVPNSL